MDADGQARFRALEEGSAIDARSREVLAVAVGVMAFADALAGFVRENEIANTPWNRTMFNRGGRTITRARVPLRIFLRRPRLRFSASCASTPRKQHRSFNPQHLAQGKRSRRAALGQTVVLGADHTGVLHSERMRFVGRPRALRLAGKTLADGRHPFAGVPSYILQTTVGFSHHRYRQRVAQTRSNEMASCGIYGRCDSRRIGTGGFVPR
jgi:hypothetical protein